MAMMMGLETFFWISTITSRYFLSTSSRTAFIGFGGKFPCQGRPSGNTAHSLMVSHKCTVTFLPYSGSSDNFFRSVWIAVLKSLCPALCAAT